MYVCTCAFAYVYMCACVRMCVCVRVFACLWCCISVFLLISFITRVFSELNQSVLQIVNDESASLDGGPRDVRAKVGLTSSMEIMRKLRSYLTSAMEKHI